jgi:hypothetical protein
MEMQQNNISQLPSTILFRLFMNLEKKKWQSGQYRPIAVAVGTDDLYLPPLKPALAWNLLCFKQSWSWMTMLGSPREIPYCEEVSLN